MKKRNGKQLSVIGYQQEAIKLLMGSDFENLDVWKRACRLCVNLFNLLENTREFWIRKQILRLALSIPSNIAEGCERDSHLDFKRFLNIAKGSAAELRTHLYIAVEIKVLQKKGNTNYQRIKNHHKNASIPFKLIKPITEKTLKYRTDNR